MKRYELLYIVTPTLTEDEAAKEVTAIGELLQQQGAQIGQEVDMGKKKLAYPIKKQRYGYYHLIEFTAEHEAVKKLNEVFRLKPELLRHLIIDKPVKSQAVLEREQALKERVAARRQRAATDDAKATTETPAETPLSAEELDQKLSKILDEEPAA